MQDLEEIAGYIARDNPAAAFAVVARIHSVIYETLDLLPRSGHAVYGAHEFAVPHLPYVIVYKQTNDDLESSASSTPRCIPKANAADSTNKRKFGVLKHRLKHAKPARIGHVAICDIEHVRYILPYKRTYMRFVGAKFPHHRKKPRRAKGTPPPMSGFRSPTPRRHSVISPALRFWDTRHDSPHACGLSNTRPKSRARRVYSTELAASREIPRG